MSKFSKLSILISTLLLFVAFMFAYSSSWLNPYEKWLVEGEQFSGGDATVFNQSVHAFSEAAPNLTGNKDMLFVTGNAFFKRNWVTTPSSTVDLDGLGPLFNARSCSSCHNLDGKASPPANENEEPVGLIFRLSHMAPDGNGTIPDPNYGIQFNTHSVLGVEDEGDVKVQYEEIPGKYADGTSYSLRKPIYIFENLNYGEFSNDIMISPRIGQHLIGLGLLEAIPAENLIAQADPSDENGDGISGRIIYLESADGSRKIGRFGWKANVASIREQTALAFREDIGMTSDLFPDEACAENQIQCSKMPTGGNPELTSDILDRVALYTETIAVPARRSWDDPNVLEGKSIFLKIGCASCHIPKQKTGEYDIHPEFSNQTIFPYTDLLLHDMGEGLADGRPDGSATGSEWRTPPLWGIGLIKTVSGHTNFLHDGRARNLEEAILWHGGEAEKSRQNFVELPEEKRQKLIKFLESL